jgi:hypothetical protein
MRLCSPVAAVAAVAAVSATGDNGTNGISREPVLHSFKRMTEKEQVPVTQVTARHPDRH